MARLLPAGPGNRAAPGFMAIKDQLEPLIRQVGVHEVARLSGVPASRIYDWLAGRRRIYLDRVEAVAGAVGVKLTSQPTESGTIPS